MLGVVILGWSILNAYVIARVVKDRVSLKKEFLEAHGQSKAAYWLALYLHDLILYLPVGYVVSWMLSKFDNYMEYAPSVVYLQPFAMLPFIYCASFLFRSELPAMLAILIYGIIFNWFFPYTTFGQRFTAETERDGDELYELAKILLPAQATGSSFIFNGKILEQMQFLRNFIDGGDGDEIIHEESHPMNGRGDIVAILIHTGFFWFVLILIESAMCIR